MDATSLASISLSLAASEAPDNGALEAAKEPPPDSAIPQAVALQRESHFLCTLTRGQLRRLLAVGKVG